MNRPLTMCLEPGCGVRVPFGRCAAHAARAPRRLDSERDNAEIRKLYWRKPWRATRLQVIADAANQCAICGAVQVRLDVDHKVPHRGDPIGFHDRSNLQALCPNCHAQKTNRGE